MVFLFNRTLKRVLEGHRYDPFQDRVWNRLDPGYATLTPLIGAGNGFAIPKDHHFTMVEPAAKIPDTYN